MILTKLKGLLINKLSVFVVFIALLCSWYDVNNRLISSQATHDTNIYNINLEPLGLPYLNEEFLETLNIAYQRYYEQQINKQIIGMSTDEQKNQSGILDTIFIDKLKLTLKAVVIQDKKNSKKKASNALVSVVDIETGENKIEKFSNNSEIYGYRLTIEKNTQVLLTKIGKKNAQNITLTMYQSDDSKSKG